MTEIQLAKPEEYPCKDCGIKEGYCNYSCDCDNCREEFEEIEKEEGDFSV